MILHLSSPEDTAALGKFLADRILEDGPFDILMTGALGCGKTTLSGAIVASLPGGDLPDGSARPALRSLPQRRRAPAG